MSSPLSSTVLCVLVKCTYEHYCCCGFLEGGCFPLVWVSETVTTTLGFFTLMKRHTQSFTHISECVTELSAPSCRLICFCIRLLSEEASLLPLSANISPLFLLLSLSMLLLSFTHLIHFFISSTFHLFTHCRFFSLSTISTQILPVFFSLSFLCSDTVNLFFIKLFTLDICSCHCVWVCQSQWQTMTEVNLGVCDGHQSWDPLFFSV